MIRLLFQSLWALRWGSNSTAPPPMEVKNTGFSVIQPVHYSFSAVTSARSFSVVQPVNYDFTQVVS